MSGNRLVWSDEFDGAAGDAPSWQHWTAELGGGDELQLQRYTASPANAALDGAGRLAIVARREADGTVTSARLITKGRVAVRYGRIEARIKVPAGHGVWPAFWMLGGDIDEVGWPACGEIDVMEYVGSQPRTVHGTLHGPGYAGVEHGIGAAHDAGVELADDFHVYGVDWTVEQITWRLDDEPYSTLARADVPFWMFDHEFYLLLNLAVSGVWPGNATDDPALPVSMLVDWVRVYA
jgi:beta-glucanase (GH16 family)